MNILLSPTEKDIFKHRLEVPDAIADALGMNEAGDNDANFGTIIGHLERFDFDAALAVNDDLAKRIIADVIEGSTYYGASVGNVTPQYLGIIGRIATKLAEKMSHVVGRHLIYPLH